MAARAKRATASAKKSGAAETAPAPRASTSSKTTTPPVSGGASGKTDGDVPAINDQMIQTLQLALQVQREIAAASERQLEMIARQHELARKEMSEFLDTISPLIEKLSDRPREKPRKQN